MPDANPLRPESDANDELKNALIAAFGVDGASFLDDGDDDFEECSEQFSVTVEGDARDSAAKSVIEATRWSEDQHDSPRTRWIKQVSTAILANDIRALSECGYGSENPTTQGSRFLLFAIGTERFGVPLGNVREIARYPNVTELPRTAAWLRGVTNFRGQIMSVTDLRILFRIPSERQSSSEKIIVVRGTQSNAKTALVVEQVLGIRELKDRLTGNSQQGETTNAFSTGSVILEQMAITLIDPDKILSFADRPHAPEQHQTISTHG